MHIDLFVQRYLSRFYSGLPTCSECIGTGLDVDIGGTWRVSLCELGKVPA